MPALFGHSLGALVAAETARMLEGRGLEPRRVGVSGRPAPGVIGGGGALHPAMTDDHIMDRLTG
ncbi:thioesterase domain-containing protein [Streptomyces sp. NPDC053720]|uniref:thioesterase domain-containing protein n=1 Tax=Streptomyces sp. NPDC053720 TaxID=3154855 RepID=UPI003439E117